MLRGDADACLQLWQRAQGVHHREQLDRFRAGVVAIDYDPALETKLVRPELLEWARNTRGKLEAAMIHRPLSTRFLIDCTKAIAAEVMTVEQAIDTFQLGLSDRQKKAIN